MESSLSGILVLDHTSALAGPYCAQMLGDFGADVIKIEVPGKGDQARGWGPPFVGSESAYFLGTNRNKRGITLNLATEKGREILKKLVAKADVLLHNVPKKSSRKKLGLDQESCFAKNPKLIWTSISGFGNTGPYAERPGYDVTVQGISGTMAATGDPGSPPMRFPTPISDITTGIYTALGVVTALFARTRTGKGQVIDNALLDCQITWLANIASSHLATGDPVKKIGNAHPSIVPYQPFPTADGWIIVGAASERLWQKLVDILGCPELKDDVRFSKNAARLKNQRELVPLLNEYFRHKTTQEWTDILSAERIPTGPINTPETILKNEQIQARGMIVELEHPTIGMVRSLANPIRFSDTPVSYRLAPPRLGEHTKEVLEELGYTAMQIEELLQQGVI